MKLMNHWTGLRHRAYIFDFDFDCGICHEKIVAGEPTRMRREKGRNVFHHFDERVCSENVKKHINDLERGIKALNRS